MEDKIEVGEYIRTKDGIIGIFDRYSSRKENSLYKSSFCCFIKIKGRKTPLQCCKEYIVKHSKNLIDLIEVGDFVNGHRVVNEMWGQDDNDLYFEIEGGFNKAQYIGEKDIKTILTKEQMKANCYKVGGEDE